MNSFYTAINIKENLPISWSCVKLAVRRCDAKKRSQALIIKFCNWSTFSSRTVVITRRRARTTITIPSYQPNIKYATGVVGGGVCLAVGSVYL